MDTQKTVRLKIITGMFLFAALTLLGASLYINNVQSSYVSQTQIKIAEQETRLAALSEMIDKEAADAVVEKIIQDCSPENRDRFDTLLGKLSQLHYQELTETKQLFDSCGNFFAQKKAVMVSRLEREYEVYTDHIEILQLIDGDIQEIAQKKEQWGSLVNFESQRSELSSKLVSIQGDIIEALLEGVSVTSDEMKENLDAAQTSKDTLIYLNTKIDELRGEIVRL